MKLSIIVPVYNVEKYIERCINSILAQTIDSFEIILIDDGSTDGSGEICDKYAQNNHNIIVIHKENAGISTARNVGIEIAKGDFIGFVDSDDWIDKNMYKTLYDLCIRHRADISTCRTKSTKLELVETQYIGVDEVDVETLTNKEAILRLYNNDLTGYCVWNKIFSRELFQGIRFPIGRIYEDAAIIYKLINKSSLIVVYNCALYNYFIGNISITRSKFSTRRLDVIVTLEELLEFMGKFYPESKEKIEYMYYESLKRIIVEIINEGTIIQNRTSIKYVIKKLRGFSKTITKNNLIVKKDRLFMAGVNHFNWLLFGYYKVRFIFK